MQSILEVQSIYVSYGKVEVLHNISLDLLSGEKVLLVGPNGAGKTTLLKSVIGLLGLTSGRINFLGRGLNGATIRERVEKGIGFLLQTGNVAPGLTVEENLALGGYNLNNDALRERKETLLDSLGFLRPKLKSRAGLLSGGERQALALSMVLMKNPKLLLLDEPSAGLAPKAAKEIINQVGIMQKSFGVETVCMVEHNLKFALEWATRVAILVEGRVVHVSDSPESYLEQPEELEKYFFGISKGEGAATESYHWHP